MTLTDRPATHFHLIHFQGGNILLRYETAAAPNGVKNGNVDQESCWTNVGNSQGQSSQTDCQADCYSFGHLLYFCFVDTVSGAGKPCDPDRLRVLRVQLPCLRPGQPLQRVDVRLHEKRVPILPQEQEVLPIQGPAGEIRRYTQYFMYGMPRNFYFNNI